MFAKCVKYTQWLKMQAYYFMVTTGWHERKEKCSWDNQGPKFWSRWHKEREREQFYLRNTIRHDWGKGRVDRSGFPLHRTATGMKTILM